MEWISKNKRFVNNFLLAIAVLLGFKFIYIVYGFKIFSNNLQALLWLCVLIVFVILVFIFNKFFPDIQIRDIMDGIWIGIILDVLSNITSLDWKTNFFASLFNLFVYILVAYGIFFLGHKLTRNINIKKVKLKERKVMSFNHLVKIFTGKKFKYTIFALSLIILIGAGIYIFIKSHLLFFVYLIITAYIILVSVKVIRGLIRNEENTISWDTIISISMVILTAFLVLTTQASNTLTQNSLELTREQIKLQKTDIESKIRPYVQISKITEEHLVDKSIIKLELNNIGNIPAQIELTNVSFTITKNNITIETGDSSIRMQELLLYPEQNDMSFTMDIGNMRNNITNSTFDIGVELNYWSLGDFNKTKSYYYKERSVFDSINETNLGKRSIVYMKAN